MIMEYAADRIRQQIQKGELCLGTWLFMGLPIATESLASLGFDWLCIDMEHTAIGIEKTYDMFLAMERHGAAPFARLSEADPTQARRLLDSGAQGLFIPVVEDAESFAEFASHCMYAPVGKRGVGLVRGNGWGDHFDSYVKNGGFRPVIIPQIETKKGVENIDAIMALDCVDAVFVGPYDLSTSLGVSAELEHPLVLEALEKIKTASQKHGKPMGYHQVATEKAKLQQKIDEGFTVIAYGVDLLAMREAFSAVREIKQK